MVMDKMDSNQLFEKTRKEANVFFILALIFTALGYLYPYLGMGVIGILMMTICFFSAKHSCQISSGFKLGEPKIIMYVSGMIMVIFLISIVTITAGSFVLWVAKFFNEMIIR